MIHIPDVEKYIYYFKCVVVIVEEVVVVENVASAAGAVVWWCAYSESGGRYQWVTCAMKVKGE